MPEFNVTFRDSAGNVQSDTIDATQELIDLRVSEGAFLSANPIATGGGSVATDGGGTADLTSIPTFEGSLGQIDDLLGDVSEFITEEEIREREEQQISDIESLASSTFDPLITQATQLGEQQVGSVTAQLGAKRGLGFSSAETGFINQVQSEVDQKISDLEAQKAAFISTGSLEAAAQAEQALMDLQAQSTNLVLQKAGLAMQLFGQEQAASQFEQTFAQSEEQFGLQFGLQVEDFNQGIIRFDRTQSLAEELQARQFSLEDQQLALSEIGRLASSLTPLDNLSDEQRTTFEVTAGLTPGTFEAYYNRLVSDAQTGIELNELTLEQARADIGRTLSLASGTSGGGIDPTDFLTRTQLNKLNISGIDDVTATIIAGTLQTRGVDATTDFVFNMLNEQAGATVPENLNVAQQLVDTYIDTINSTSFTDQMNAFIGAAVGNVLGGGSFQDTSFDNSGVGVNLDNL